MIDATHDRALRCWVPSAEGHPEFPVQNLPFGVFSPPGGAPRGGVAIGDMILDLAGCVAARLLRGPAAEAAASAPLNAFLAMGAAARRGLRVELSGILCDLAARSRAQKLLHTARDCALHLPATIGDYSDFFAGIAHARNGGRLSRPDNPLLPNYKYVPIAYHGRASSIRPSGTAVRRPSGQRKPPDAAAPTYGPCRNLDYEMELGIWIGPGNALGEPIPIGYAAHHIAGFCLLNDWSARDIQSWEYQPLGPFLAKSFQTSISPWIVTPEALAPFRTAQPPRPADDPAPLPHLRDGPDQAAGALDLTLEAAILTPRMRERGLPAHRLSRANADQLYWTVAQMVAHQTSAGCNLNPGDLFGSGTISSPEREGWGCLMELTQAGRETIALLSGETRRFLEDGDEIILAAHAARDGFVPIGFGECRGTILPQAGPPAAAAL
jgi:fumarylacetoacetase